ncbi:MAG: endopeptidase La [Clostridia bacterium]|nr:endopeptidase La [Clostridia bacterium]MDR3644251.1 endopeptidase La [Clostridia bacterium]
MFEDNMTMPVLALRGIAVFPGMMLHFDVGRKKSVVAMNEAMKNDQEIFLVAQLDIREDDPAPQELYKMGTIARIKQLLHLPGEGVRVLVEGVSRARLLEITQEEPYYIGIIEKCETKHAAEANGRRAQALIRSAQRMVGEYSESGPKLPQELVTTILAAENAGDVADYIASNIFLKLEDKQSILEELSENKRLELVLKILEREIRILEIENDINAKVREQIDKNQRDYFLREQFKTIANELGEGDNPQDEAFEYHERIAKLRLPDEAAIKLHKEAERLMKMPFGSHEATVVRTWLDTCLELPWNKASKEKTDLEYSRKVLENDHYGLEKVKERILEFIAVRKLNPDIRGQIICFVGPPGVGKTSIGKSIARAMGRKYTRVSLGGVRDEADIRGHRKTYIGAMPGRIINAVTLAGTNNPLILLDEVDKLCSDMRGDPSSALLEVLDAEQNFAFRDHFIELPFDLSNVVFITTANTTETIPEPLLDRMEVIPISSYTREEKYNIALRHLLLKQLKRHGLSKRTVKIENEAIYGLIDYYTREAGVRGLERQIASLCRKAAKQVAVGGKTPVVIRADDLERLLGPKKYKTESISEIDEVGVVTGLAWTQVGGETMPIEVAVLDGSGKLELTGSLGDVMKESAKAAISYIRSRAKELHIEGEFYKNKDIHIHVPEGAIPKDGPSAGITMATALVSALLELPVRHNVAMTGEITLRGRVLPIGGLREKTMAAYRAGIGTVIIPKDNFADLSELESIVREHISFVTADSMEKVLNTAIIFPEAAAEKKETCAKPLPNTLPMIESDRTMPSIRQ